MLDKLLKKAREHPRTEALEPWYPNSKQTYVYAADASMEEKTEFDSLVQSQIAICARLGSDFEWKWRNKKELFSYIGEAELEAIVWCVRDAVKLSQKKVTTVLVATDSLCAKGWIERMYSDRPIAQKLLREPDDYLTGKRTGQAIRLSCIYVRTDHNISDIPSRTSYVSEKNECYGSQENWTLESDSNERMKASSVLLKVLLQTSAKEGIIQGREVIKNREREVTEMPIVKN